MKLLLYLKHVDATSKVSEGGVPLYKTGKLVGSVGVGGDLPEVDEEIAVAASVGFEPPSHIQNSGKSTKTLAKLSPKSIKKESPATPKKLPPLVVSSESVAKLPTLPLSEKSPLPKALPSRSKSQTGLKLPPVKSSPSLAKSKLSSLIPLKK